MAELNFNKLVASPQFQSLPIDEQNKYFGDYFDNTLAPYYKYTPGTNEYDEAKNDFLGHMNRALVPQPENSIGSWLERHLPNLPKINIAPTGNQFVDSALRGAFDPLGTAVNLTQAAQNPAPMAQPVNPLSPLPMQQPQQPQASLPIPQQPQRPVIPADQNELGQIATGVMDWIKSKMPAQSQPMGPQRTGLVEPRNMAGIPTDQIPPVSSIITDPMNSIYAAMYDTLGGVPGGIAKLLGRPPDAQPLQPLVPAQFPPEPESPVTPSGLPRVRMPLPEKKSPNFMVVPQNNFNLY